MSTIADFPTRRYSPDTVTLIYRPSIQTPLSWYTVEPFVFWKLYTSDGVRYTPALLTNGEVMAAERDGRLAMNGIYTTFQYWQPEWQ